MEKSEKSWNLARLLSSCRKSRQVSDEPYIVIRNFEDTCEKECAKYDKINQQKYDSLISKAVKAHKTLKKTGLSDPEFFFGPEDMDLSIRLKKYGKIVVNLDSIIYHEVAKSASLTGQEIRKY